MKLPLFHMIINAFFFFTSSGCLPCGSAVKNLHANGEDAGDAGLIPGPGKFPGEGNGNPLQYPYLEKFR